MTKQKIMMALIAVFLAVVVNFESDVMAANISSDADVKNVETQLVNKVLDEFHVAASKADGATYFSLFAPEGVFIGTDAGERWTVSQFRLYAEPHFKKGKGWTYKSKVRHVDFAPGSDVAWIDEILDSKSYGTSRGTGVLRKIKGDWRISQYHLTFPIPNALADKFTKEIRNVEHP